MSTGAHPSNWLWESPTGRLLSLAILGLLFLLTATVKWGGLRAPGVVDWEAGRWILGWAPSFLAGVGMPFLWPVLGRRLPQRIGSLDFLPECLSGVAILFAGEFIDSFEPDQTYQTFDPADLVATVAGAAGAFLLFRVITRFRTPLQ